VIWRDADNAGQHYLDDVAEMLRPVGVATVRSVQIPERFRDGLQLNDE